MPTQRSADSVESTTGGRRSARLPAVLAIVLALCGVILLTVASCSSTSGPPQPSPAAAGTIDSGPTTATGISSPVGIAPGSSSGTDQSTTGRGGPNSNSGQVASSAARTPAKPSSRAGTTSASRPATPPARTSAVAPAGSDPLRPPTVGPVLARSAPTAIAIPSIGVSSSMLDLGLNPDGTVEVPSLDDPDSKAGWFHDSPTPGALGPSIILGHIDSKKYGPGVFYQLGNLKPGATVEITRQDGTVAVFRIDGVRSYPKNAFPSLQIYGNIDHAGLRLITCGGTFDPNKGSYESNIVAFGSLVSSHRA